MFFDGGDARKGVIDLIDLFAIAEHVLDFLANIIELVAQLFEFCVNAGELLVYAIEAFVV
jgi:hypothetical protein